MKTTALFLIVALSVATIHAAPQKRDVSSSLTMGQLFTDIFTSLTHIMPCGDSDMQIPILAPFRLPIVSLDINHELLTLNGTIKNLVVTGLDKAVIIDMSTDATTGRTSFDTLFNDIQILGEYDLYVNADLAGFKVVLNLNGLMNLQFLDIRSNGGVNFGVNSAGGVVFTDQEFYVEVGDVISHILDTQWSVALNDYINKMVGKTAVMWIQLNRELINELISNFITQEANTILYNVTMSQFMQYMANDINAWNSISCSAVN